jgi:hypothetical protein
LRRSFPHDPSWLSLLCLRRESPPTEFEYRASLTVDRDSETAAISRIADTGVEIAKQYRWTPAWTNRKGFARDAPEMLPRHIEGRMLRDRFGRLVPLET